MDVKILNVLAAEQEIGMDDFLGRDERGCSARVEELSAFGSVGSNVFEGNGGFGFVDGIKGAFITNIFLRDEGDATP